MDTSFNRFASVAAMLTGVLSILYAVFFLVISKTPEDSGRLISWLILGAGGLLTTAAYVGLYQRLRGHNEGLALWGLLLGLGQGAFSFTNAVSQALLIYNVQSGTLSADAFNAVRQLPQAGDPGGVWAFVVFALASFIFGRLILNSNMLPRTLGYVAWLNAVMLVLLFIGNVTGTALLIYVPGGLTSLVLTPVWWIWVGRSLASQKFTVISERALAS